MRTPAHTIVVGILIASLWTFGMPVSAFATYGWEIGDEVFDFGPIVEPGESAVLVDSAEVGEAFSLEVTWRLDTENCILQVQTASNDGTSPTLQPLSNDGLFKEFPSHANVSNIDALLLTAKSDEPCEIDAKREDFVIIARQPRAETVEQDEFQIAPLGAIVMAFRATSFFVPDHVTIRPGERVVWIYADGAHEPHSVTSGGCPGNVCSGGGKQFDSGPTLTKPGHRFEHVFNTPGTFIYHCDLHLASMMGTVTVKP